MLEARTKVLVTSVKKLYRRGAWKNIKRILDKTHIADIGSLLQELDKAERLTIFQLIPDVDKRAEILAYIDSKEQKDILLAIDRSEAKDLVSLMDSDDAADLLGNLPKEFTEEILNSMHREDSEDVADLMRYPEDTAGGLMSTDFLAVDQNNTVAEAIKEIQNSDEDNIITFYLYVVDEVDHLVGVISLKELILSKPSQVLKTIMTSELISVGLDTDQEEVARIVEHYDFLSLPVVDESNKLEGIITVDDVIDVIREESQEDMRALGRIGGEDETVLGQFRGRFPWLLFTFLGGLVSFLIIRVMAKDIADGTILALAGAIPMLLSFASITGGQSSVVTVGLASSGRFENGIFKHFVTESVLALIFSVIYGLMSYWVFANLFELKQLSLTFSLVMAATILLSSVFGTLIPILLQKMKFDPAVATVPLVTVISDIVALCILFGSV